MRNSLTKERKERNLTRGEVARDIELSEITIRKLEEGARNPSLKTAGKLSNYYNKKIEELFPDIFFPSNDTKCIT